MKLVPILQARAAGPGCSAAGVESRPGIYGQPFAPIQIFVQIFWRTDIFAAQRAPLEVVVCLGGPDRFVRVIRRELRVSIGEMQSL